MEWQAGLEEYRKTQGEQKKKTTRKWIIIAIAGVACLAVLLGILLYSANEKAGTMKFRLANKTFSYRNKYSGSVAEYDVYYRYKFNKDGTVEVIEEGYHRWKKDSDMHEAGYVENIDKSDTYKYVVHVSIFGATTVEINGKILNVTENSSGRLFLKNPTGYTYTCDN